MKITPFLAKRISNNLFILSAGLILLSSALLPALAPRGAEAAQITHRALTLSSGVNSGSGVDYTFTFRTATSGQLIRSIKLVFCDSAVATYGDPSSCTKPTGLNLSSPAYSYDNTAESGFTDTTNKFAKSSSDTGNCAGSTHSDYMACLTKTSATNDTNTATDKTIKLTGITNPSTANSSFYVGIYVYTDAGFSSLLDNGTVAAAVTQSLTVNAAVAEILNLCVGGTAADDATSGTQSDGTTTAVDCGDISGTSVNLGTLDSGKISVTPESTNCTSADCGMNGVVMLRTNASNGATVSYDSIQQSLLSTNHKGSLLKLGGTCNDGEADNLNTSNTDDCFNVSSSQAVFNTTNERFGMSVAYVNCDSTTSYTCTYSSDAYNLKRNTAYDCSGANTTGLTDVDQITGPTQCGYAWDESGTITQIASSTSSATKQVDDEALILKFAAHPMLTTPFGAYTAKADFIAVATY
jgi:hypothetical protein